MTTRKTIRDLEFDLELGGFPLSQEKGTSNIKGATYPKIIFTVWEILKEHKIKILENDGPLLHNMNLRTLIGMDLKGNNKLSKLVKRLEKVKWQSWKMWQLSKWFQPVNGTTMMEQLIIKGDQIS